MQRDLTACGAPHGVAHSVAKAADDRLAAAVAAELAGDGVASVSAHPAWTLAKVLARC